MRKLYISAALIASLTLCAPSVASAAESHYTAIDQSTYSANMTIVAKVMDGESVLAGVEVAVFAGTECRTTQVSDANGYVYLTVPGDASASLTFSVFGAGKDVNGLAPLTYLSDMMVGNITDPYVVNLNPTSPSGVSNPSSIVAPGSNGSNAGNGGNGGQEPVAPSETVVFQPIKPGVYSGNMTLVAIVKDRDAALAGAEIGVYAGSECRGAAVTDDLGRAFVTISGNATAPLTLSVHTASLDTAGIVAFDFVEDAMIGNPSKPYVVQVGKDAPVDPGDDAIEVGDVSGLTESMTLVAVIRDGAEVVPGAEVAIYDGAIYRATAVSDAFGHVKVTIPGQATEDLFLCVRTEGRGFVSDVLKFQFEANGSVGTPSSPTVLQLDPSYREENALRAPRVSRLTVYPNPAVDYVVVNAKSASRLVIASESGAVALTQTIPAGETRVDVSALPVGLYAVRVGDSAATLLKK